MNRIAKKALFVLIFLCFVIALLFGVCWYYNGFAAAWAVFFGSDSLSAFLSFVGVFDWLISIVLAIGIAGIFEAFVGHRISIKITRTIVDFTSGIVGFVSILMLLSNI